MVKLLKAISLFSGALGLDIGLEKAGIKICLVLDNDPETVETIQLNRPDLPIVQKDIGEVTSDVLIRFAGLQLGEVDMIAGGPPCQAFSVFGKRKGIKDPRGQVIFHFLRIISEIKPKAFVMENVRGLLSMKIDRSSSKGSLFALIQKEFEKIGYRTDCFVVNSANYGAPQIRERIIVIGNNMGLLADFPKPTHSNRPRDNLLPFATLGQALDGFVDPDQSLLDFSDRKKKYLSMVPPGCNWRALPEDIQKESMGKSFYLKGGRSAYWRKLSFEFPCPTIMTMPNHAGTSLCHPTELRPLTVGECAHIQGFPAEWKFAGSPFAKYKQVGNAVPIILGEMAGRAITNLLMKKPSNMSVMRSPEHKIIHLRPHVRTRWWWRKGKAFGPTPYYGVKEKECIEPGKIEPKLDKWIKEKQQLN